jgi:prevent-host-death family protein
MPKTISASHFRDHARRVLNEVHYTEADYIVEKFGQPAAVVISMADYERLQIARRQAGITPAEETDGKLSPGKS